MLATRCHPDESNLNSENWRAHTGSRPTSLADGGAQTAIDQDAYLNSVALNLHSFYSGLERIFELIAQELDGGVRGKRCLAH